MVAKVSAGLLMYRFKDNELQVFLVHPGGPFWAKKDAGVWSIPKGLIENENDDLLETAKREFLEETGIVIASGAKQSSFVDLGFITYKNGKQVYAWAFEQDLPENFVLKSNPTPQGWPETDRGQFFNLEVAKTKILAAQTELLSRLSTILKSP